MRRKRSFQKSGSDGVVHEPGGRPQAAPSPGGPEAWCGVLVTHLTTAEAGGPEGGRHSLWVPSLQGTDWGGGAAHQNDWNFPSHFVLTICNKLQPLIRYHVSKSGIH